MVLILEVGNLDNLGINGFYGCIVLVRYEREVDENRRRLQEIADLLKQRPASSSSTSRIEVQLELV